MHSTPETRFLADRVEILAQLADVHGGISAARLARRCALPLREVQQHLADLERAGVVAHSMIPRVGLGFRYVESDAEREARRSES